MTAVAGTGAIVECPHGDPRPHRCALCRRDANRAEKATNAGTGRLDTAALAAGERDTRDH